MRLVRLASRAIIVSVALACTAPSATAREVSWGPLQPMGEIEILKALAARNGTACGGSVFYPWFAGMLASSAFKDKSPAQRLETIAGLFGTERARKAFSSAANEIAALATQEAHSVPFPKGAPSRPLCTRGRLKPRDTLINYSRPYRAGELVFIEQTIGSHTGADVGILALEEASGGGWKIADMAIGPIAD